MAMDGIKLALEKSRDASLLYVFTDASAKDYDKFAEVEALSQKKLIQIVFVLTGICSTRTAEDYLVYHKLAKATSGQVFHLQKSEVGKLLNYVMKTIEGRKNVIASKVFPAGYGNVFNVEVDSHTKELVIAVSGERPSVEVTDSAEEKSYLSIKLSTEGGNVELKSVQILDMDNNIIVEEHVRLVDKKEQFYITEPIDAPNHMFRIAAVVRPEAGAWLHALPSPQLGTLLNNDSLRIAVALRGESLLTKDLHLTNLSKAQAGSYLCLVQNDVGSDRINIILDIL
ncbi:hypothetical protein MSG28_009231 [Choristoneura fumiferana]|uniref:Uncharacterized protein n=1 Tax=Choristoneura fumiferana TaxID=7141 RepID=A0ACC0KX74_CHOFU|nr:hypothetical protein MSG28_009231 [Choristoneura fumiferana]